MAERIVAALDGSTDAEAVLEEIPRLVARRDAEIVLVRAVQPIPVGALGEAPAIEFVKADTELMAEAERYIERLRRVLDADGVRVRGVVRQGWPARTIINVATEAQATLLALTTHGRTGIARLLFGSVAEHVLRHSPVPLFVVRTAGTPRNRSGAPTFRRILAPIGDDELSLGVIDSLKRLARPHAARVLLLHVAKHGLSMPAPMRAAERSFQEAGLVTEMLFREGAAAGEILEAVARADADLIAMTTHGRSGVPRWVLGSVTEGVLRSTPVPMLIVRYQHEHL